VGQNIEKVTETQIGRNSSSDNKCPRTLELASKVVSNPIFSRSVAELSKIGSPPITTALFLLQKSLTIKQQPLFKLIVPAQYLSEINLTQECKNVEDLKNQHNLEKETEENSSFKGKFFGFLKTALKVALPIALPLLLKSKSPQSHQDVIILNNQLDLGEGKPNNSLIVKVVQTLAGGIVIGVTPNEEREEQGLRSR